MKNKVVIMWGITAICAILTVVFWFLMNKVEVQYEEVSAIVTDTSSKEVVNKNTQNRTTFYEVKVEYNGKEWYPFGTYVKVTYVESVTNDEMKEMNLIGKMLDNRYEILEKIGNTMRNAPPHKPPSFKTSVQY